MAQKRAGRARKGTGSIVERSSGRFVAQVDFGTRPDGSRDRRARMFGTRQSAEAWLLEIRSQRDVRNQPVAEQRLDSYLRWWLTEEAPKGKPGRAPLALTTLGGYQVNVEQHLIPELGHIKVGELTVSHLDAFAQRKVESGCAPATVNRIRGTLRSALSTAVRQDKLSRNVARLGGGVGEEQGRIDRFTDAELKTILSAAETDQLRPLWVLLARTGLRLGEAVGLRWRDLTLDRDRPRLTVAQQLDKWGTIVRPKSRHGLRTVGLRPEVVDALLEWAEIQGKWREDAGSDWHNDNDLVFTTRRGRPLSKRNVARSFTRLLDHADVRHGSIKVLRSTVATQLAEAGTHPERARQFLGHSQITVTMKYYTTLIEDGTTAGLLPEL